MPISLNTATDETWWLGKRPRQLIVRQRINANVAKAVLAAVAGPDDWIFHIDGDEVLLVDRPALAALGPDVPVVRMPPLEAVSRKRWPGGRVTHFKKMLAPEELTLLHVLGVIAEPTNGHYFQTADSGAPLAGLAGSTIVGESNEQSNTDIASEFSKMIVTQQAYSANTRVMSTAQTMMSDLLNVIR